MPEKTIETKACKKCGTSFEITDKDLEFYKKISPTFNWKKYNIPSPTLCIDCKTKKRLMWRNERTLYQRKCNCCNKPMISIYAPEKKYNVYCQDCWESDKWSPLDYGQDIDFEKTFAEQFGNLLSKIPLISTILIWWENNQFNNSLTYGKNTYYTFSSGYTEDVYYSYRIWRSNDLYDSFKVYKSENSYELVDSFNCNNCLYLKDCEDCSNSKYLKDCIWCNYCIACIWLHNASYHIGNKEYSPTEYKEKLEKLTLDDIKKIYDEIYKKTTAKTQYIVNCENSTGSKLKDSKNAINCNDCEEMVDCKNVFFALNMKDCRDCSFVNDGELAYESLWCYKANRFLFDIACNESYNMYYCNYCNNCENCFGSIWLKNQKYCIFNKQYSKDEYEKLVPQIIEHMKTTWEWGEFFPSNISPFDYNEGVANRFFPLTKEKAIAEWFTWQDNEYPINVPENMPRIEAKDLPELKDLDEKIEKKIINTAIICEDSWKPYRILQQELSFYKKHGISLPKKHPDIRHQNRMDGRKK